MKEVEVSTTTDASKRDVLAELSPESIIEFAGTFEIDSIEDLGTAIHVTVVGGDLVMTLEFEETANGYRYQQIKSDGPFEKMRSQITVNENEQTQITATSEFTFGGPIAFITDRWGVDLREEELERLVHNLASAAESKESEEGQLAD